MNPEFKQVSPMICEFEWDCAISDELLQQQLRFQTTLQKDFNSEIIELRMGFKTLALILSNISTSSEIENWLKTIHPEEYCKPLPEKIWQIPVCYSPETGRDLEALARHKNISQKELISMHSQPLYRIHFYGFLPGFMYLNGLKEELHAARKNVPDRVVPPGSVAIGGSQTGIYPSSSPGGWHLIGQTPISLFDPRQAIPVFAEAGERIEFTPITIQEFEYLKKHPQNPKFR
ncbi:5-oxoprolinase subunit PxpB [Algoriphagus sp. D3-2-R+10]|uniref:5-oxoprolinase subunit PxpB n=1 Tax=Algoriphagus aurantiacus TaxID=3103948 RepID=UPI002B3C0C62|nr:5-oxoprolinase subunit PxpB [Algoriphagus sp. D3-2-R+10]MEB2774109.1 5-oxoprolinase subunit PxpB [Algoriphagus sp. D3-2-R+10]